MQYGGSVKVFCKQLQNKVVLFVCLNQVGSLNKINHEINKFEQENQRHLQYQSCQK